MASEVQIIVSAKDLATQTIKGVTGSIKETAKVTDQFASSVSRMSIKATIALAGLNVSAKKLLDVGSAAVELDNVVAQTFKNMSKEINQWANDIAAPMNRSRYQMREFAGMLGAMIVPMMKNMDLSTQMSKDLAELAVDMASFWNVADEQVFTAFRSGLVGQIVPLQRFGINMSVASLQAFAFEKGIKKSVQTMTESEKMYLRYEYLLANTAIQQGDAARNADTYANSLKGLNADVRNTTEGFGSLMQPLGVELVKNLREGVQWLGSFDDETKITIIRWGAFGTALLGGIAVFALVTKAIAVFVNGLALVGTAITLLTSPIMIKFALITAGIALVANAWEKNLGGIQDKTKSVANKVKEYLAQLSGWWHGTPVELNGFTSGFEEDQPGFKHKLLEIKNLLTDGWKWSVDIGENVLNWVLNTTWADKWTDIKKLFDGGWKWAITMSGDAWKWFSEETDLGKKVEEIRQKLINSDAWKWTIDFAIPAVIDGGKAIINAVIELGGDIYKSVKTGLDTGDWSDFWSVASETWAKGVLIAVGLSSTIAGLGLAKNAIITGLGLATSTGKAMGAAGLLGLFSVGIQLMEAKETGLGYEDFGRKLVLALATGIGIGAFTGSPKVGALAFTVMLNLDWEWIKDPIEKALEPVRQFLKTSPSEEGKLGLDYRSANEVERKQIVQDLNMPDGELVNQPNWWDRVIGKLGYGRPSQSENDNLIEDLLNEYRMKWLKQQSALMKINPLAGFWAPGIDDAGFQEFLNEQLGSVSVEVDLIPIGMEDFTDYLMKELSGYDLPAGLDPRWIVGQLGAETGWGQHYRGAYNLGNIKGTGTAGSVVHQDVLEYIDGKEVYEEAYFAAYNSLSDFMNAYLKLLETTYPLAWAAQDIEGWVQGLLSGNRGAYATSPNYYTLLRDVDVSLDRKGYSTGVILPGYGGGDRRPALLEDGEAVVPKEAVRGGRLGVVEWFKKMGAPGFQKGRLPLSMPGISMGAISDAEVTISGMQDMFSDLGRSIISGFVTMFEVIFDLLENVAIKIFGEEAVATFKETIDKGKKRLQGLLDTLYLPDKQKEKEEPEQDEDETKSSWWREWHENFAAVNEAQKEYVTTMTGILQNYNQKAAKSISNLQSFLDSIANMPEMTAQIQEGFIGLREQISAIFGGGAKGNLAGVVGGGATGWQALSQGGTSTNWVGGIAGALAGAGIGGPITAGIAVGSQIIGSFFPGKEKKKDDEILKERIDGYNKTLEEWGASFRSNNVSFEKDGGLFGWRNLFGNVKWETVGKELAEKGAEVAERLIRSMESIFDSAGAGLFDVIFDGADLTDFSKTIGKQMQQTLMAEILNMEAIKGPLQALSAYIAEAAQDGFSVGEMDQIKELIAEMYEQMGPFKDMAAELAEEFGLAEESARGLNSSLRNAPSGYKVDLTRWHATKGVSPTGDQSVSPSIWSSGARAVQVVVNGSVNGVNDLKRTIQDALDEYDRKKGNNELAYSGVMV